MAMLLALALIQAAPAAAPDPKDTIVVTATIGALREALETCKRGGCTPRQDVIASIRYAEALFRSGRYLEMRHELQDAIERDRKAAKSDPIALATLYEATATGAAHDGEQAVVRSATYARAEVLRDALPADSATVLTAERAVADLHFHEGRFVEADRDYRALAKRAEVAQQHDVLAGILLHQADLRHVQHEEGGATDLLNRIIGDERIRPAYRTAARACLATFARERGDKAATDAAVTALAGTMREGPPVLLWQPPVQLPADIVNLDYFNRQDSFTRSADMLPALWADIGFLIRPDGTVEPPQILRGSRDLGWSKPLLSVIARRRYAPPAAGAASYRIERWTLTADYDTPIGSLIRRRVRNPHFEQLDLTAPAPETKSAT